MLFVFPSHCYMWWRPAFLDLAEHLLPLESAELIPFLCLCAWPELYLLNCLYLNPQFSLLFQFSFHHEVVG